MKRILCFGDSNTWGTIPDGTYRHSPEENRYTNILQKLLGADFQVIAEGLPARTTNCDDIKFPKGNRNGALYFPTCLISHQPIDYVVLLLGTNDLKECFQRTAKDVAKAIQNDYIKFTKNVLSKEQEIAYAPKFVVVCPASERDKKLNAYSPIRSQKSQQFDKEFSKMAKEENCLYVSNKDLECGPDCTHLNFESHKILAKKLCEIIKNDEKTQKN